MKKTNKTLLLMVFCAALGTAPIAAQVGRPPMEGVPGSAINQNRKNPGPPPTNGVHPMFRSINGSNNNVVKSRGSWGAAVIPLLREMPSEYGPSDPKNAMGGASRPSARAISNTVCDEPVTQFNARNLSAFVYVWGQFIDHDVVLTPSAAIESVPILLPANEPLFTQPIPFERSEVFTGTGVSKPREQINLNTAWIDASMVYGSEESVALWLRTRVDGKLKTSTGNFLPWNTIDGQRSSAIDPKAPSMANDGNHTVKTYVTGDVRGAEHPGITGLHTLFVREHNRICDRLKAQGFRNDEEMYQRARKEVGAIVQAITYEEFLPALGVVLPAYNKYNDTKQPDILNTFATAGFRIGHTMVADDLSLRDNQCRVVGTGSLDLLDAFFNVDLIGQYSLEAFLKGFATHKQYETDLLVNNVLRNFLFGSPTAAVRSGLDLAALNIQRGRDHGLPNYKKTRAFYTGTSIRGFSEITNNKVLAASLQSLYGSVEQIDLWVGLLAEDRLPGKSLGRTMEAMLRAQFEKLRDGDFYFYKNDPFFSPAFKNALSATKLSDIIKRNSTLSNLQSNVFVIQPCPGENGEGAVPETPALLAASLGGNTRDIPQGSLRVFPNPANEYLTLDLTGMESPGVIQVFNTSGLLVHTVSMGSNSNRVELPLSTLASGVYFVRVVSGDKTLSHKFVKE